MKLFSLWTTLDLDREKMKGEELKSPCPALLMVLIMVVIVIAPFTYAATKSCQIDTRNRPITLYCPASMNNYEEANRSGNEINYIVVHTVQGSLNSAINTFQSGNLDYPRSAHFTIGKGGKVVKSVRIQDIAWHAGTSPIGSGGRFESDILNANSIGIEHAGFVDDPDFPTLAQYIISAALVRLLCAKYDILIDRKHIVSHSEIKSTKQDPGPNWDWDFYMRLVKYGSTTVKTGSTIPSSELKPGISPSVRDISMIAGAIFAVLLAFVLFTS